MLAAAAATAATLVGQPNALEQVLPMHSVPVELGSKPSLHSQR